MEDANGILLLPQELYKKYGGNNLTADALADLLLADLEEWAWSYAKRGANLEATTAFIAKIAKPVLKEFEFASQVELRRLAARVWHKYLDKTSVGEKTEQLRVMLQHIPTEELLEEMESMVNYQAEQFGFGIFELDNAINGGIRQGQTLSLVGSPGSMKTSLLLSGIENWISKSNQAVHLFELDMESSIILSRLLMREMCMSESLFREHVKAKSDLYKQARKSLKERLRDRLFIHGETTAGEWTIDGVEAIVQKYSPGLVAIDYLGLLKRPGQSPMEVMMEVVPRLVSLAKLYGCAMVILNQMGMESMREMSKGGAVTGRGGSETFNRSDVEMTLMRDVAEEENKTRIICTITKNRLGQAGRSFELLYDGPTMRFLSTAMPTYRAKKQKPVFQEAPKGAWS